jgi:broad specificity phosphatase PhoE
MKNKYCTLYIVRHGETDWNVKQIIQGHSNSSLTQNGKRQIRELEKNLKHIHFDALFSSDLLRTKQTSEILNIERKLAITTTDAIRERYFGKYEGMHADQFYKEVKDLLKEYEKFSDESKRKFKYPTSESDEELISRVIRYIREIAVAYPSKKVLVVSHGGVLKNLLIHLGWGTYKTLATGGVSNGSYIVLESDGVDFIVKETNGITKNESSW